MTMHKAMAMEAIPPVRWVGVGGGQLQGGQAGQPQPAHPKVRRTPGRLAGVLCVAPAYVRDSFMYIGSPNGPIQRMEPVRYVQYECYETTARSETRKLARVRPARCALPRLKNMVLKVVKMGT
jgi:hypothetical protein